MTETLIRTAPMDLTQVQQTYRTLVASVETVIRGKHQQVGEAVLCLLAQGHLLIEDVPGVGKTSLARALADAIGGRWRRIQFTADLLPSDVTGVSIFDQRSQRFRFEEGPVFANVVVADEINRASPRTQSALLEVMAEHQVSVDGTAHPVPQPFLVVATQNPIDMDGTYPLPEAQLDRFLIRLRLDYPDESEEMAVLAAHRAQATTGPMGVRRGHPAGVAPRGGAGPHVGVGARGSGVGGRPGCDPHQVMAAIRCARGIRVDDQVSRYIVRLAQATRQHQDIRLGASTRATLALQRIAQVRAGVSGRDYVSPDDVQSLVRQVFSHRILVTADAELRGVTAEDVVSTAIDAVAVPREPR